MASQTGRSDLSDDFESIGWPSWSSPATTDPTSAPAPIQKLVDAWTDLVEQFPQLRDMEINMPHILNDNDVFASEPGFGSGGNNPAKVLIGAGVIADPYEVRAFIGDLFTNKTGFFEESKLSIDAMTLLEFEKAIKTADRELKKTEFFEAFKLQLGLGGKQSWKREVLDASKEFMRVFDTYMRVRNELQEEYEKLKTADAAHSGYAGETFLEFMKKTENRMKKYLLGQNEIKKQKHIYSLEDFGLNEEKINIHLENYIMNNNF